MALRGKYVKRNVIPLNRGGNSSRRVFPLLRGIVILRLEHFPLKSVFKSIFFRVKDMLRENEFRGSKFFENICVSHYIRILDSFSCKKTLPEEVN